jgi:parallel beta-helix repeat protein
MGEKFSVWAGARISMWVTFGLLLAFSVSPRSAEAGQAAPAAIACTESALRAAIGQANAAGGGTITFTCSNTVIPMTLGLGDIASNVVIDGEDRNITLEYAGSFSGCDPGDNGVDGPRIGRMNGTRSVIRHLTFRNFLESLQISGPENTVEDSIFTAHTCSDDGLSTTTMQATSTMIRNNRFTGYRDKAFQMSYGNGTIEGNTFIDSAQPIRGPYDNVWNGSSIGIFVIRNNIMRTTGNRELCNGPHVDGSYRLVIEGNTIECYRGLRLDGWTNAIVRNNTIDGNTRLGVLIGGNAVVSLSGNTITNNGLSPGSEPAGGVVIRDSAQVDLGGGTLTIHGQSVSSTGGNRLTGNGTADVRNLRPGYTIRAEGNCWDHIDLPLVGSLDLLGIVDIDPLGTVCGATGVQAPSPPSGVRLVTQ